MKAHAFIDDVLTGVEMHLDVFELKRPCRARSPVHGSGQSKRGLWRLRTGLGVEDLFKTFLQSAASFCTSLHTTACLGCLEHLYLVLSPILPIFRPEPIRYYWKPADLVGSQKILAGFQRALNAGTKS